MIEPPASAFKQVIAAPTEDEVWLLLARYYPGADTQVRVREIRPTMWVGLVAMDAA